MTEKRNLKTFLTKSKRGKEKINDDGHSYNLKEERGSKKIWRCVDRKCPGSIHTDLFYDILSYTNHNHVSIRDEHDKHEAIQRIKNKALETTETPRNILFNELVSTPEVFIQNNLNFKYLKDTITRTRKKNNIVLENNSDIPNELFFLSTGERFYFFDSGINDENRIIIFTTAENLNILIAGKIWFVDATFKTVPKNFEQLLIIQTFIQKKKMSLFYCLMKRKNEI